MDSVFGQSAQTSLERSCAFSLGLGPHPNEIAISYPGQPQPRVRMPLWCRLKGGCSELIW